MLLAPGVFNHLLYSITLHNVPVQHAADQVDALLANDKRDTQVSVHNLIDTVERVLFVNDGV